MARRSFLKKPKKSQEMSLQITSMADIFTIILIFLLKSYSVGALEVNTGKGIQLPQASLASMKAETAMKVEVSENAVSIEGKPVSRISGFSFPASDMASDGSSRSLMQGMAEAKQADSKILLVADQRAPFETIKAILTSAAARGYTDVKLAVTHVD